MRPKNPAYFPASNSLEVRFGPTSAWPTIGPVRQVPFESFASIGVYARGTIFPSLITGFDLNRRLTSRGHHDFAHAGLGQSQQSRLYDQVDCSRIAEPSESK